MKFGKKIRAQAVEEWADRYVDYKNLKHLLKPIIGTTKEAEEDGFAASIIAEIDRVDEFFIQKESELYAEFRLVCQKVSLTHLEVRQANCASIEGLVEAHNGTPAGQLIKDFLSLSAKVDSMRKFVMMNTLAIVKITKKHDKHNTRQLQAEMVDTVHKRHFYSSARFGSLITDIEMLATQMMSRLTDAKPLAENYSCTICLGILCNPVVLSCGHRFCMKCVSAASYFCQTSCPVCRKEQILDLETIKVDTLLSHFLDRYFPEGQSGVKQCKTCAYNASNNPKQHGRSSLPCEECNISVLDMLSKMQSATISHHQRDLIQSRAAMKAAQAQSLSIDVSAGRDGAQGGAVDIGKGSQNSNKRSEFKLTSVEEFDMEVRPRLKRRNVGKGGKQALGGRPQGDAKAEAPPIMLNATMLRAHFNLPLNDAAKKLGVCATAIKKVCRKIGIKQWPHRKLKAVEKRLALLKTEHQYTTDDADKANYIAEIQDLEQKRGQLLQGEDIEVPSMNDTGPPTAAAQRIGRAGDRHFTFNSPLQGEDCEVPNVSGLGPPTSMAQMQGGSAHNGGARQPTSVVLPSVPIPDGPTGLARVVDGAANLPMFRSFEMVEMRRGEGPEIEKEGWAENDMDEDDDDGSEGMEATHSHGLDGDMTPSWMPAEPEDDVWEMLHQMMDEPTAVASMFTSGQRGHEHGHGHGHDHRGSQDMSQGSLMDINFDQRRISSLEEEVMSLRQFTMTLIKERGDLAMQIQDRDAEILDLRAHVDALEQELRKYTPHTPTPRRQASSSGSMSDMGLASSSCAMAIASGLNNPPFPSAAVSHMIAGVHLGMSSQASLHPMMHGSSSHTLPSGGNQSHTHSTVTGQMTGSPSPRSRVHSPSRHMAHSSSGHMVQSPANHGSSRHLVINMPSPRGRTLPIIPSSHMHNSSSAPSSDMIRASPSNMIRNSPSCLMRGSPSGMAPCTMTTSIPNMVPSSPGHGSHTIPQSPSHMEHSGMTPAQHGMTATPLDTLTPHQHSMIPSSGFEAFASSCEFLT